MDYTKSLSVSMRETLDYSNLEFLNDIGELIIDTALNDSTIKEIPILGSIVGVGKCIKNISDILLAKKLIAFLIPIKDISPEKRANAIKKWEEDKNFRGKVGDTLLGMIQRCDDAVKAVWLSKLFYELVLKRSYSQLFMRAEKVLSSLSVMDVQSFLNMPPSLYIHLRGAECEPYIGSGLYQNPKIESAFEKGLNLDATYCEPTEVGIIIYHVLNNIPIARQ